MTSIGSVGNSYAQNVRGLEEYYEVIDRGELPVFRGLLLNRDDELRRDVITRLICHFNLVYSSVEQRWGIKFGDYFSAELDRLKPMVEDGLLEINDAGIKILPRGRLLIRNICMTFDIYLEEHGGQRFSKVI